MTSNLKRCLIFARKPVNINVLRSATLLLLNKLVCQQTVIILMYIIYTLMSVPSYVRIERGSYGGHDFKLNKVPLFRSKTCEYQCFKACCPKIALLPSSCYNCDIN